MGKKEPFQSTLAPETNPDPFTVSVNAGPPAVAELGLKLERDGDGAFTLNVSAFEVRPPGFCTVMLALVCEAISAAGTEAVN